MSWLILGDGLCGKSLASYFSKKGKEFYVYDDNKGFIDSRHSSVFFSSPKEALTQALSLIKNKQIKIALSPGISLEHPIIQAATLNKNFIISEADLALKDYNGKLIAVTGTNGKSTVASMCQHILEKTNMSSELLGNIGKPLSSLLLQKDFPEFVVAELSSYQLEQMQYKNFFCSLFTNFAEDHLERHKTLQNYFRIKTKIFQTQAAENSCGFWSKSLEEQARAYGFFSSKNMPITTIDDSNCQIKVPKHLCWPQFNHYNATLALQACAFATKKPLNELSQALESFQTIPHRFETIAKTKNMLIINDSKATNIDATEAALKSILKPTVLLLGGLSKTPDFSQLVQYSNKISTLIAFGDSRETIALAFKQTKPVLCFQSLSHALDKIKSICLEQEAPYLLLSPACASFDEFKNFSERGNYFTERIREIFKEELI